MTFLWHQCIANIHQHSQSFFTGSQTFLHKPLICMLSGTLTSMMKKCSTKCTWYIYFLSVSQNFRLSYILFFTDVVCLIVNSHLCPCITGMWWQRKGHQQWVLKACAFHSNNQQNLFMEHCVYTHSVEKQPSTTRSLGEAIDLMSMKKQSGQLTCMSS